MRIGDDLDAGRADAGARARGGRPDVHGRSRDPAVGARGRARARPGSGSRSTRRATRPSVRASPVEPLRPAPPPLRRAARSRARRHARPRRRHDRERRRQGREERRRLRPRQARLRLARTARADRPRQPSPPPAPRRLRPSWSRPTTPPRSSARCSARTSSRARSTSSTPAASPCCSRAVRAGVDGPGRGARGLSLAAPRPATRCGPSRAPGRPSPAGRASLRAGRAAGDARRSRRGGRPRRRRESPTSRRDAPRPDPALESGRALRSRAGFSPRFDPDGGARVSDRTRRLRELTSDCVHCGFCLPTCPTYVLWSEEMDSPRGRIQLMEAHLDGTVSLNRTVVEHFDRCLGCMACVSSCPSGVRYDRLIEATRRHDRERDFAPLGDRLLSAAPCSSCCRTRSGWAPRCGSRRSAALALAGPARAMTEIAPPWRSTERAATSYARAGRDARARRHSHRLRAVGGVRLREHRHGTRARGRRLRGRRAAAGLLRRALGARRPARGGTRRSPARLIAAFDEVETVVVNASGCGSHLKELGWLLGDDPAWAERAADFSARVRDVGEFLRDIEPRATRHPLPLRVALQDSCHLRHAQRLPLSSARLARRASRG